MTCMSLEQLKRCTVDYRTALTIIAFFDKEQNELQEIDTKA